MNKTVKQTQGPTNSHGDIRMNIPRGYDGALLIRYSSWIGRLARRIPFTCLEQVRIGTDCSSFVRLRLRNSLVRRKFK